MSTTASAAAPRPLEARWPEHLEVLAWPDALLDTHGFSPRSSYVETYWLGILGPSATWLLRRLDAGLEAAPGGYTADLGELAACLGLRRAGGRRVSIERALERCVAFGLAQRLPGARLAVRRHLPPLPRRHLERLPRALRAAHEAEACCTASRPPLSSPGQSGAPAGTALADPASDPVARARQLALSLARLGEPAAVVEATLLRWRVHPALIESATTWALTQVAGRPPTPGPHAQAQGQPGLGAKK